VRNTQIHINVLFKAAFLLSLVSICLQSNAQDTASGPIEMESIIEETNTQANNNDRFETMSNEDLMPVAQRRMDTAKIFKLKGEEDFWYINEVPPKKTAQSTKPQNASIEERDPAWICNLLWFLVVGGFIAILIWFLIASDVKLFRKSPPVIDHISEGEDLNTENIYDIDYEESLKRVVAAGNYRMAIRLLYLQTLKEMAVRNLIRYKQERTNNDYLIQLFQTTYYRDFFRLTRNFEYAWYGQFPVSSEAFAAIQQEFSSFKQRLSS